MLCQVSWTFIITWCLALKSLNSESTSKVYNCRTPNDEVGSCVPVKSCKSMMDYIQSVITATVEIVVYDCGFQGKDVTVCCPDSPIINLSDGNFSTHKNVDLLPKDCGLIFEVSLIPRITAGFIGSPSEVPWIALLSYNTSNGTDFRCTGSVINDRYILTAAHCTTQNSNFKLNGVRCGEQNLDTEIDCEVKFDSKICAPPVQDMEIEEIIPHPNYNPKTYTDDIALIRLATSLNTSQENVRAICLPVTSSFKNHSGWLTATSWRLTTDSRSAALLKTEIKVTSKENCEKAYPQLPIQINDKQLCTDEKIMKKLCVSDGGGPLQGYIFDDDARAVQYGVASFGPLHCESIDSPFVYTKTESYLTWILDNLRL